MANASQLKAMLHLGPEHHPWYTLVMGLIIISIILQVAFAVIMIIIWYIEKKTSQQTEQASARPMTNTSNGGHLETRTPDRNGQKTTQTCCNPDTADILDFVGIILVLLSILTNAVITGFGITDNSSPEVHGQPLTILDTPGTSNCSV